MLIVKKLTTAALITLLLSSCTHNANANEPEKSYLQDEYNLMQVGGEQIKWVSDIPIMPSSLVGRVYIIRNDGSSVPFILSAKIPTEEKTDATITKSVLKKAGANGDFSFSNIFTIKSSGETAIEFQVIQGERWITDTSSDAYISAIENFISRMQDMSKYDEVYMVQGVIKRKIWLKKFKQVKADASLAYFIKIDGTLYGTNNEYEEVTQYGLLLIPLISRENKIDITKINLKGINSNSTYNKDAISKASNVKLSEDTLNKIPSSIFILDEDAAYNPSKENIVAMQKDKPNIITVDISQKKQEYLKNNMKIFKNDNTGY